MNRLVERLDLCRREGRLMLVGYLPAGYPDADGFTECVTAAFDGGVDAMEIAVPNPPVRHDGALIQRAASAGAAAVPDPVEGLRRAAAGRRGAGSPIIAMVYRQAFETMGAEAAVATCTAGGAEAVLLPEHTMAEQLALAPAVRAAGLEPVIFLHREQDLPALVAGGPSRPVIYLQSASMRTGETFDAQRMRQRVRGVRRAFGQQDAYVLVGFGIRGSTELTALSTTSADGAAIGTAMVEAAGAGAEGVTRFLAGIGPAPLHRPAGRTAGS